MTNEISSIDMNEIHVLDGPPGGHGFRKGNWQCEYKGKKFQVFASVSHSSELDVQHGFVKAAAARHLAKIA